MPDGARKAVADLFRLLGVMDIEQIMLHLDRFDAIEYGADGTLV